MESISIPWQRNLYVKSHTDSVTGRTICDGYNFIICGHLQKVRTVSVAFQLLSKLFVAVSYTSWNQKLGDRFCYQKLAQYVWLQKLYRSTTKFLERNNMTNRDQSTNISITYARFFYNDARLWKEDILRNISIPWPYKVFIKLGINLQSGCEVVINWGCIIFACVQIAWTDFKAFRLVCKMSIVVWYEL